MATITGTTAVKAPHAHHWVIDEPGGPVSAGTCKLCGATRPFKNWIEEADYLTSEERKSAA